MKTRDPLRAAVLAALLLLAAQGRLGEARGLLAQAVALGRRDLAL